MLAVLISLSFAAAGGTVAVKFDFGGVAVSDQAPGYQPVEGSLTTYPTSGGGLQFGWTTGASDVQVFNYPQVSDPMRKDANGGTQPATFDISGLTDGSYDLQATIGSPDTDVATKMQMNGTSKSITVPAGSWKTLTISGTTSGGSLSVQFLPVSGQVWMVNGMTVATSSGSASNPSFAMSVSPSTARMTAGETASFTIAITPANGYADSVGLSVSGLAGGISGQITPAEISDFGTKAILRVTTPTSLPPADYTLLVTGTGTDPDKFKQTAAITLTVSAAPGGGTTTPGGGGGTGVITQPEPTADPKKAAADTALLDKFAADKKKQIPNQQTIVDLKGINTDFGSVPVFTLPAPTSVGDSLLQPLVRSGIIGSTVETAPFGQKPATKPVPWYSRIFAAIFSPTS